MTYTLGTAARATGLSKSTIHRAIKAGRISAGRTDTGDYAIDPAELHRVFAPAETNGTRPCNGSNRRPEDDSGSSELAVQNVRLQAEVAASSLVTSLLRQQLDETREDRDRWRTQAERLVALPAPPSISAAEIGLQPPQRPSFVAWLFKRA